MNTAQAMELSRLSELETVIERGQQTFIEVGLALTEIRESKLYRQDFSTFEDYCQNRWGWSRPRAYALMEASEAVTSMSCVQDIPQVQNARQATELAKIKDPEIRAQVWKQVNEVAAEIETVVTAKIVKEAVEVQRQIELKESGRGIEKPENFPTIAQALAENKESPGYKWRESLNKTIEITNSIKNLGGIIKLSEKWTAEQRSYYADRCRHHAETLIQYAEEIENL